ncbi:MAG TPA: flagellar biosynthesis protein FliQ [Dehalococcoidia bacterium]
MGQEFVVALGRDALWTAALISAPVLIVSLVLGIVISMFQAMTQIHEVTLTFVPKIIGVFAVLALFGPWMLNTMTSYTAHLLANLAQYGR